LLIRKEAMKVVIDEIQNEIIIAANGYISRDLFNISDKESNFYMIGSMGLASSIGLGVAIKNSKKQTFIFDGDGNILMNFGSLVTIGSIKPKNLIHIVFDNSRHASTGGQPTNSKFIEIEKIAQKCNYSSVFRVQNKQEIIKVLKKIKTLSGPIMILIKISHGGKIGNRIEIPPIEIKERFMKNLEKI